MTETDNAPRETGGGVPELYDTTLRDGTQREGVNLSVDDKLKVAGHLDALGVNYIEGGWPGANPKDTEFFTRAAGELDLERAELVAFGSTRHPRSTVDDDATLRALLDAETEVLCIVGKASAYHVDEAFDIPREDNLAMIDESIRYLVAGGRRVFFDAEHFFDGHTVDRGYAVEVVRTAAGAGADCVVLCDTNGGTMPWTVEAIVTELTDELDTEVGVHFHDDGGCAVANSLVGVRAGAGHVQGTANGLGERCGNANLFTILADLQMKQGLALVNDEQLAGLTHTAHAIAELCNQAPPSTQPYVGSGAFTHKAGLHASALAKASDMYQHVEPSRVGNEQHLVVSELAGRATVVMRAEELGIGLDNAAARRVLEEVKTREHAGWSYDAADASFELLLRRLTGDIDDEPFELQHFRVTVGAPTASDNGTRSYARGPVADTPSRPVGDGRLDPPADSRLEPLSQAAEAIMAVNVKGERRLGAGEGNGPVDALDHAFRNAVEGTWPQLDRIRLADYKVRILESTQGTDAVTRVLITTTDGEATWDTVGVHGNIVEASWLALADAYVFAITRGR